MKSRAPDPRASPDAGWPPPDPALEPGLYIVSTPIGNLRDITFRALDILAGADVVLAEDTRISRRLLDAYGVATPMRAYHDHNAAEARPDILRQLGEGARIALISDAGTPLVSDPGYKLVREAAAAGAAVVPIPGPSAALAGLAASGLPTDAFLFAGFPPARGGKRRAWLNAWAGVPATLVFYEAPSRLRASLAHMADAFGSREAALARELTKKFEEIVRAPLPDLAARYAEAGPPKGELVILVGPPRDYGAGWDHARIDAALREAMASGSVRDAALIVAEDSGWPKREVYARALALKDSG